MFLAKEFAGKKFIKLKSRGTRLYLTVPSITIPFNLMLYRDLMV